MMDSLPEVAARMAELAPKKGISHPWWAVGEVLSEALEGFDADVPWGAVRQVMMDKFERRVNE